MWGEEGLMKGIQWSQRAIAVHSELFSCVPLCRVSIKAQTAKIEGKALAVSALAVSALGVSVGVAGLARSSTMALDLFQDLRL